MRALVFLTLCGAATLGPPSANLGRDIDLLRKQTGAAPAGRAAWERVSAAGPEALLPLLRAMNGAATPSANWLRTAFDRVADREVRSGGKRIDADSLTKFVQDRANSGKPRRLALDLLDRLRPGAAAALVTERYLDDPEFRFDAVERLLNGAAQRRMKGQTKEATDAYRRAFHHAQDVAQSRIAAAALAEAGQPVSVAKQLGFLTDWYLIGPFDGGGMKGFHTAYPPERSVDLTAEQPGQGGRKLRWKRYTVREPAPTSKGRHQALVDLRARAALGDADDAVAFAYTAFAVEKGGPVEFRGAADDNLTVWVNGERVFGFEEWRNGVRHDRHRFRATLRPGTNTILVKVCQTPAPNPEPNWEFFLRLVDAAGQGVALRSVLPAEKQ